MKRSEINSLIRETEDFFERYNFSLPEWAGWKLEMWEKNQGFCAEIFDTGLGWDLTDFGSGSFFTRGLTLFTLRNGKIGDPRFASKPYAEKIMMVREEQETPYHYHWKKVEDIINRGGGVLVFELAWANEDDTLSDRPIILSVDGVEKTFPAQKPVFLSPGQSITLPQKLYHRFYALKGKGSVLCGEVSTVNDDQNDNRFFESLGRFPDLEEDTQPYRLMVGDYGRLSRVKLG